MLTKIEANIPSQAPQSHSRPPPIGPMTESKHRMAYHYISSLHSWFCPEALGKIPKKKRFQEKSVCVCASVCVCLCMCAMVSVSVCVCKREKRQHYE